MSGWTHICPLDALPVLGARVVEGAHCTGDNVAIFRTADDRVFALRDRCPHKGGPLSQGIVYGESVACPLHNWSIDLASGCAHAPDRGRVQRVPVRVDAGAVYLRLGDTATAVPVVERAVADD